jgi:FdhD protein
LTHRYDGTTVRRRPDQLIVEEPLEIHLDGVLVSTTMRTPGHDFELAAGFCFTEGLLAGAAVRQCKYCGTGSAVESEFNVVTVDTGGRAPTPTPRLTVTTSACGVCGSTAVDELRERLHPLPPRAPFGLDVLAALPKTLAGGQRLFDATGGVHAAVAFDWAGAPVLEREDIGRHNAVDKVVGRLLLDDALPAHDLGLWVSGRASFEIVQKAWAAGFGTVVAVSAPSSLAVSAASLAGMTLCGFARGGRLNVYSGMEAAPEGAAVARAARRAAPRADNAATVRRASVTDPTTPVEE